MGNGYFVFLWGGLSSLSLHFLCDGPDAKRPNSHSENSHIRQQSCITAMITLVFKAVQILKKANDSQDKPVKSRFLVMLPFQENDTALDYYFCLVLV